MKGRHHLLNRTADKPNVSAADLHPAQNDIPHKKLNWANNTFPPKTTYITQNPYSPSDPQPPASKRLISAGHPLSNQKLRALNKSHNYDASNTSGTRYQFLYWIFWLNFSQTPNSQQNFIQQQDYNKKPFEHPKQFIFNAKRKTQQEFPDPLPFALDRHSPLGPYRFRGVKKTALPLQQQKQERLARGNFREHKKQDAHPTNVARAHQNQILGQPQPGLFPAHLQPWKTLPRLREFNRHHPRHLPQPETRKHDNPKIQHPPIQSLPPWPIHPNPIHQTMP